MPEIILIVHNIRSTHNVGSLFRSAEGFGVQEIILSGYSPYPLAKNDHRLPHLANKIDRQIHKTALGAEKLVKFRYQENIDLLSIKNTGYRLVALEQADTSIKLSQYCPPEKLALIVGEEVNGVADSLLELCDDIVEIPMRGQKESFNVAVAAGVALYHLTNT